jgi:hypothetical protein
LKTIIHEHAVAEYLDSLPADARSLIERELDTYALFGKGDVIRSTMRSEVQMSVGQCRLVLKEDPSSILVIYIGRT